MRNAKWMLLGVLLTAHATAGEVYKCKDAAGHVTFTNIKCPDKATVQHYGTYEAAPDSPDQYYQAADTAQSIRDRRAGNDNAPSYSGSLAPASSNAPPDTSGFQCAANGKTWIQSSPCPATSSRTVTDAVSGTIVGTGEHVSGTATRRETVPVTQRNLSRDELCDQLGQRAKTAERGRASDSAYERNKMRANSCR